MLSYQKGALLSDYDSWLIAIKINIDVTMLHYPRIDFFWVTDEYPALLSEERNKTVP